MNPIFTAIERLINEHGSASIMKERLLLASDRFDALERDHVNITQKNISLRKELAALAERNEYLEAQLKKLKEEKEKNKGFDDTTKQIVNLMFEKSGDISPEAIARHLDLELGVVKYHFDLLGEKGFVQHRRPGVNFGGGRESPACCDLTCEGRAYAVKLRKG